MPKRLPMRSPHNKGAKLPLLAPKPSGSGTAGFFDQMNGNSISRQPPAQPQQSSAGVQAAPWAPIPPLSQFPDHVPPDWRTVYNQVYSQTLQTMQGRQQGSNMPASTVPPFPTSGGPSRSSTEAQPLVHHSREVIDLTADGENDTLPCPPARAPMAPPPRPYRRVGYQPATRNARVPVVPLDVHMPGQNVSGHPAPYAFQGQQPSLHASSHESTGSVGSRIDPLFAPAPVSPFIPNQAFDQSFTRGISEPPASLAEARAGKRRCDTPEATLGINGEASSRQSKRVRYARQAQSTAEDAHATSERAAVATAAELERWTGEEAHKAPPAESGRVEEVIEEEVQGDDKENEAHGSDLDHGEQSSGDNQDSGYAEQSSDSKEEDSEESAEPEQTGQGNQEAHHENEATADEDFSDLLNLEMFRE